VYDKKLMKQLTEDLPLEEIFSMDAPRLREVETEIRRQIALWRFDVFGAANERKVHLARLLKKNLARVLTRKQQLVVEK
jgi:ribosomal protein L29